MASAPDWLSLDPGEEVVWTGHPRLRRILSTVATAVLWSVAAVVAAVAVPRYANLELPSLLLWGGVAAWVGLQVVGVARAYLVTTNVEYVMTTENLYKKTGVASENVTTVGLDRIQNVELTQDVTGNLFDYGSVKVSTAGSSGVQLTIDDLDNPGEFRADLRERANRASDRDGDTDARRSRPDGDTLSGMVEEARKLRESAERIQRQFN